jgi:hypothetical protein
VAVQIFAVTLVIDQAMGRCEVRLNGKVIHEVCASSALILNNIIFVFSAAGRGAVWNPVTLFDPGAEVKQTAAFGTERPVVVVDPGCRTATTGTWNFSRGHHAHHKNFFHRSTLKKRSQGTKNGGRH